MGPFKSARDCAAFASEGVSESSSSNPAVNCTYDPYYIPHPHYST